MKIDWNKGPGGSGQGAADKGPLPAPSSRNLSPKPELLRVKSLSGS